MKTKKKRIKPIVFGRKTHRCEACGQKLGGNFELCYWCRRRRG